MNQVLRRRVYGKGTQRELDYIAQVGGMNAVEREVFMLLHDGHDAEYIKAELYIDRKKYDEIENAISTKLAIAVFYCINNSMRADRPTASK